MTVLGVDSDQVRVDSRQEQHVTEHGHAAIHPPAARPGVRSRIVVVHPERAASRGIERHNVIGRLRDVHNSVGYEWGRFKLLQRLRLEHPFQFQVLYVRRPDLLQRDYIGGWHSPRST